MRFSYVDKRAYGAIWPPRYFASIRSARKATWLEVPGVMAAIEQIFAPPFLVLALTRPSPLSQRLHCAGHFFSNALSPHKLTE
jgi:hypothetical protein